MAERPIFVPSLVGPKLVHEIFLQLEWHSGFAPIQKERNIEALHSAAAAAHVNPVLEVSSKSQNTCGRHLSAFHLKVRSMKHAEMPLECAFQGSKVFVCGGPFTDLYTRDARDAKRDPRLQTSGALIGFQFDGYSFPLEPKTTFYDWLYINSLYPHREWCEKLFVYGGFTDIEFNPQRSINCQARSCALFIALMRRGLLDNAVKSPDHFIQILSGYDYRPEIHIGGQVQAALFAGR